MAYELVITAAVNGYRVGTRITDPADIAYVEGHLSPAFYVRTSTPASGGTNPPPPSVTATDTFLVVRNGIVLDVSVGDLLAYLLAALPSSGSGGSGNSGGSGGSTPGQFDFSDGANSGLIAGL